MSTENRHDQIRQEIYEKLAMLCNGFSAPARLKMIQALAQAPRSVDELSKLIQESIANTSQHLQKLAKEGVLICQRQGVSRIYRIVSPEVLSFWENLQNLGHALQEDLNHKENTLTDLSLRPLMTTEEILQQVSENQAILLDVRDITETSESGIQGAKHHPATQPFTDSVIQELGLRKRTPIYVYCRGRYCSLATGVVRELRILGYKAYRLRESPYILNLLKNNLEKQDVHHA